MGNLTATKVKNVKTNVKSKKVFDGRGLYLLLTANGSKYWRYDYRFAGKRKTLALGVYPDITLQDARNKHQEARRLLALGKDPGQLKRELKQAHLHSAETSFGAVASEWFMRNMEDKSHSYRDRTLRILEQDLYPSLSNRPISEIKAPELLRVLRKIEERTVDIAHRAKQTSGLIFRYAVATGITDRDPTTDLSGALRARQTKHHSALTTPHEVGELLRSIDDLDNNSSAKTALQLSALLFQRPGEIRHMEWIEIDWQRDRWELPPGKMKMGREHIVPLSQQAIALLKSRKEYTGNRHFVFPSPHKRNQPISENTVRKALRSMGYTNEKMTPHGFRAMARTLLDEELNYRVDIIEHQLAHAVKDPTGRAYNRTKFIDQRTKMMQAWADYLDRLKGGKAEPEGKIISLR